MVQNLFFELDTFLLDKYGLKIIQDFSSDLDTDYARIIPKNSHKNSEGHVNQYGLTWSYSFKKESESIYSPHWEFISKSPVEQKVFEKNIELDIENYLKSIKKQSRKTLPIKLIGINSTLSFGKFKGMLIKDIPQWYLSWCVSNINEFILHIEYFNNSNKLDRSINTNYTIAKYNSEKIKRMYGFKRLQLVGIEDVKGLPIIKDLNYF